MIENVGKEWDRIDQALTRGGELPPKELKALLESVKAVRGVLQRMSQVSVTRTTLKSAVREDWMRETLTRYLGLALKIQSRVDWFWERCQA